jgi:acyl-ACP thioesterase
MYEFTSKVRYSEITPDGRMTLPALTTRMQDCSVFHSEAIGRGPECWIEQDRGWIIVSWQILIHRMPVFGESITTKTWAYRFHRIEGDRNFLVQDEEGRILAETNARYIYFDLKNQIPVPVPEEEQSGFGVEEPLRTFTYSPRKILLPKVEPEEVDPITVQPMSIDTNHHVNNIAYIQMADSCLPEGARVREMRIQYSQQAYLGDVLYRKLYREEGRLAVSLEKEDGTVCAVVDFHMNPT